MLMSRFAQKAWSLFEECRYEDARAHCVDALDRGSDDPCLHHAYGLVLYQLEDYVPARRHLQIALANADFPASSRDAVEQRLTHLDRRLKHGGKVAVLLDKAGPCVKSGKHAEAIQLCERGLAEHPRSGALRVWLGCARLGLEQLPAAREQLLSALQDPDLDDEYVETALARIEYLDYLLQDSLEIAVIHHRVQQAMEGERFFDALSLCRKGLKSYPAAWRLRMPLASALVQLGEFLNAREYLNLILQMNEVGADDRCLAHARLEYVEEVLAIGVEFHSLIHRACEALRAKRWEECRRWCECGLESHPRLAALRVVLAAALIRLGEIGAAREQLALALSGNLTRTYQEWARTDLAYTDDLQAHGPEVHSFLTRAHDALAGGRPDDCRKWSECGMELFPAIGWRFGHVRGHTFWQAGQLDKARAQFILVLPDLLDRENRSDVLQRVALLDVFLRDRPALDRADELSQEALTLTGANPDAHATRGVVVMALGRFEEGAALVRRYLDGCPPPTRASLRCFLAMEEAARGNVDAARANLGSARRHDPVCPLIEMAQTRITSLCAKTV
jgi:tetratricopeptide (TPR) repeat protein